MENVFISENECDIAFFIMHASIGAMITINGGAEKMLEGATTNVVGITSLFVYMCFFSQNTVIGVPGKVLERFFIKNSKIVSFEKERIFLFSSSLSADTAHI